jgi:hypothetical protein
MTPHQNSIVATMVKINIVLSRLIHLSHRRVACESDARTETTDDHTNIIETEETVPACPTSGTI